MIERSLCETATKLLLQRQTNAFLFLDKEYDLVPLFISGTFILLCYQYWFIKFDGKPSYCKFWCWRGCTESPKLSTSCDLFCFVTLTSIYMFYLEFAHYDQKATRSILAMIKLFLPQ